MRSPTYAQTEQARAAAWKQSTGSLPTKAKVPAPYIDQDGQATQKDHDHCIPPEFAELSLLPEVRLMALDLFTELAIPWHAGIDGGPSNNLLSSQVQCVNACGQMVNDPDRLILAFAGLLGTVEVLEIEPGRHLTFEYIGDTDYFGEATNGVRTRGSKCTSVDAAFVHRTSDGLVELILLEWKYTETYSLRKPQPDKDLTRFERYGKSVADPGGPIRGELVDFEFLLDEPLYQLMRQQLMADRLEQDHGHGAERARVVHVLPPANTRYQRSLHRPAQKALGATAGEAWAKLLRRPDRFVSVDPAMFLDPEITSTEYVCRYGSGDGLGGS
jgi:hypothetical protein